MVIFKNNIKRLLRDKFTFIMMVIMPVIFISLVMFMTAGNTAVRVAVIDKDNTEYTRLFIDSLSKNCSMLDIKDDDIQKKLLRNRVDYVLYIDKGFTDEIIAGKDAQIKSYSLKETNTSYSVRYFVQGFIDAAKNIAKAANGNEESFYRGMNYYNEGSFNMSTSEIDNTDAKRDYTTMGLGFLIMFMMYLSVNSTSLILEDKELKTYGRVLSSPLSMRSYTIQNMLSAYMVNLAQISVILIIMKYLFNADFGPSMLNVYVLLAVFGITAVSLGFMINGFSKDSRQSNSMSTLVIIPLAMLGGCFWPKFLMPDILQQISKLVPTSWALDAVDKLLYGQSLVDVGMEISIILLFAVVFFLISSNGKRTKKIA